jgi:hypothetical protein
MWFDRAASRSRIPAAEAAIQDVGSDLIPETDFTSQYGSLVVAGTLRVSAATDSRNQSIPRS